MRGRLISADSLTMRSATKRGVVFGLLTAASAVVCAAQIPFFSPSEAVATVKALNGQVSVLKDSYPLALDLGAKIRPQQIITTGSDGFASFEVSDGSTFEVFPNSRVVFRNNPGTLSDLLDVLIGRVKVHIQKLGGLPNPNRVMSPAAVISVRGTTFDVVVYDDESTLVSVEEGLVEVRHAIKPGGKERMLGAGDTLRVYKDVPLAKSTIDKSKVVQAALRSLADAFYTVMRTGSGSGTSGGGSSGGGTTTAGDSKGNPPPPPPPPGGGK